MATTATELFTAASASGKAINTTGLMRRRSIDPQTGHALVVLCHAIEYLTDEFICQGGSFTASRGHVDAIQLLMKVNREIYMACPEAPSIWQWLRSLLRGPSEESSQPEEITTGLHHGRI
jgi:hypothetical protein